jgi:hypothetical protein
MLGIDSFGDFQFFPGVRLKHSYLLNAKNRNRSSILVFLFLKITIPSLKLRILRK